MLTMRPRMRRLYTLVAVLLSSGVLVYFYPYLNFQMHQSRSLLLEDRSVDPIVQQHMDSSAPPEQESVPQASTPVSTIRPIVVKLILVSDAFRKAIPVDMAFWNRKLGSRLKQLDKGEFTADRRTLNWTSCREMNQELLRTNMHDFSAYPELHQDFLRGMDCKDPPILIDQPKKCEGGHTFLLFAIKSTANNFEQRQAVRETWGKEGTYTGGLRVRTVFLLGGPSTDEPDLKRLLSFEARYFGDILQWDFEDSFFNLTLKEHVFFRWALEHCSSVSFVFKGDDDVFVNRGAILSYLHALGPEEASKLYVGQIINSASPLRNAQSKYYVPLTFYNGPYPSYAGGGGFVFSGALLDSLFSISHLIPMFPIDDVYAGMCFQALGITPTAHTGFQTFDIQEQDRENLCIHKTLLLVHRRSPKQVKKLWRGVNSPLLTC